MKRIYLSTIIRISRYLLTVCAALFAVSVSAQKPDSVEETTSVAPSAITGRVISQSGQPIANATVRVLRLNSSNPPRPVPAAGDGSFKISGLEPGVFLVSASAPSFVPAPADSDTDSTALYRIGDVVTLSMVKGGVINGTVTGSDGQPVVAVRVRALMIRDSNGNVVHRPLTSERLTDDRGIYRLYGLAPGTYVVSAGGTNASGIGAGFGGRGPGPFFGGSPGAIYDRDAPTFAPSSTRDTATELSVASGQELNDVNIKYRGERGHAISGTVKTSVPAGNGFARSLVTLARANHEGEVLTSSGAKGSAFEFYGVADGEYVLSAQSSSGPADTELSRPQKVIVNGANVSGVALTTSPLGHISGRVVLEPSADPVCQGKRQPRLEEILVSTRRRDKRDSKEPIPPFSSSTATPGKNGEFFLNKLIDGQYPIDLRFSAKYWYLRAVTGPLVPGPGPAAGVKNPPGQSTDLVRAGLTLKPGANFTGVSVMLTAGAASLRGLATFAGDEKLPHALYLVPAEKHQADNLLRYFGVRVTGDGQFSFSNLPPGAYWAVGRTLVESETPAVLRIAEGSQLRSLLRREGEATKKQIELKACQNITDYNIGPAAPATAPVATSTP
jgi:hypothetical protein